MAELKQQRVEVLCSVIETKVQELAQARQAVSDAAKAVTAVEDALHDLKIQAGLIRYAGRRGKAGRKPWVSLEIKRAAVVEALKNVRSGASFRELRAMLLDLKDTASGGPLFAGKDFASSSKFSKQFLPSNWKIKGERREAAVVKG